jgi:hypothetical protein
MRPGLLIGLLMCAGSIGLGAPAPSNPTGWRFPELRFRVPLTIHSGLYLRENCLVRWPIESKALLQTTGVDGPMATNSFRVVAEDSPGEIAHLFVPRADGAGELRWLMPGQLDLLSTRRIWVYFDTHSAPGVATKSGEALSAAELAVLLPDEPTNLVRNPGFEIADPGQPKLPAEWLTLASGDSTGTVELVNNPRHSGLRALKLEGVSGGWFGVRQEHIPLKPNRLYRVGVWGRADAANTNELMCLRVLASLVNAAGKPVSLQQAWIEEAHAVSSDTWEHIQKRGLMMYHSQVKTPPDTASCNLKVYFESDASREISMSGIVYIDDVELVEVRPQDLVPGVRVETGKTEQGGKAAAEARRD